MTSALAWARDVLDRRERPLTVFFRDDDAGWRHDRLGELGRVFVDYGIALDVAAIPSDCTAHTVRVVEDLHASSDAVALHQHGYRHSNHEPNGRKSEFGNARSYGEQRDDIARGRERLCAVFGSIVQPIFTPPWNRCSQHTADALEELGFRGLSRDAAASRLKLTRVAEVPVNFDWQKKRDGQPLTPPAWRAYLEERLTGADVLGVMLHHAVMDAEGRERLRGLLVSLLESEQVRFSSLRQLVAAASASHPAAAGQGEATCIAERSCYSC